MKFNPLKLIFVALFLSLFSCSSGEGDKASDSNDPGDNSGITKAFDVEIDENSVVDISSLNADAYEISGTCDSGLGDVTVVITSPSKTQVVNCLAGSFSATFDLSDLTSPSASISVEQGGESDTPSAAPANDQLAAAVTLNPSSEINYSNYLSYEISGECSENGQEVSVVVGGVPSNPQPFCTNNVWSTLGVNTSSLINGPVLITVDHSDGLGNAANQVSQTVSRSVIIPSVITAPTAPKDPNWTLKIRPGDMPVVTSANASSLRFSGYCASGQGDVTIRYGSLTFSAPCNDFLGIYQVDLDVSSETLENPAQHCASQSISSLICSTPVTNELAPPGLNFIDDPLGKITPSNQLTYRVTGSCAPVGASISIDVGSQAGILTGNCLTRNRFDITGDLSSVIEGVDIIVSASITANSTTTVVSSLVSKGIQVSINTPDNILVDNFSTYDLSGTCSDNGQQVILNIGGYMPSPQPICTNRLWSLSSIDLSSVPEGDVLIAVSHLDEFGNAAVPALVSIIKDMIAPTVTIASPQNIGLVNELNYSLSGTCSEEGRDVIVSIGGYSPSPQPECIGGVWSLTNLDVSTVAFGSVLLTANHNDQIGNSATQAIASIVKDTTAPTVSINMASNITSANETSYSLSGMCSEEGREVTLNIGGLSPFIQPLCVSGEWSIVNFNASSLPQGIVSITANHSDIVNNSALEALITVGKFDPITFNLVKDECANPFTEISSYSFLGDPTSNYDSVNDVFSVNGVSNWRTYSAQEPLPEDFEISFTIEQDSRQMLGFANSNVAQATWTGMESVILFYDNAFTYSYANGTYLGNQTDVAMGGFPADVRVEKIGNTVTYYMNENVFRVDATVPENQDMYLTFAGLTGYTASYKNLRVKDLSLPDTGFFIGGSYSDPNGNNGPYELYDVTNDVVIAQINSSPFEVQYNSGLNIAVDLSIRSVNNNTLISNYEVANLSDCLLPLELNIAASSCLGPTVNATNYTFQGNPTSSYNASTNTLSVTGFNSWNTLNSQEALPEDFKITYTITSDTRQMMGFGNTPTPSNTWTGIESFILFYDNTLTYAYGNGSFLGSQSDAAMGGFPADIRIEKMGNTVTYFMNDNEFNVDASIPSDTMYITFGGSTAAYTANYQNFLVEDISPGVFKDYKISGSFVDPNGVSGLYEIYDRTNDVVIGTISSSPFEVNYNSGLNSSANIVIRRESAVNVDSQELEIQLDDCI